MNHKILCKSCKWEKIYTGIPTTECNEYVKVKKTNMEKVAKMLGVEIGEEFRIKESDTPDDGFMINEGIFEFTKDNLIVNKRDPADTVIGCLLIGQYTIRKIPKVTFKDCNPNGDIYNPVDNIIAALRNLAGCFINEISAKPWKPTRMEGYYYVDCNGVKNRDCWNGCSIDYCHFNTGNCFKTEEEITPEIIEKILKEMKGKYESQD